MGSKGCLTWSFFQESAPTQPILFFLFASVAKGRPKAPVYAMPEAGERPIVTGMK